MSEALLPWRRNAQHACFRTPFRLSWSVVTNIFSPPLARGTEPSRFSTALCRQFRTARWALYFSPLIASFLSAIEDCKSGDAFTYLDRECFLFPLYKVACQKEIQCRIQNSAHVLSCNCCLETVNTNNGENFFVKVDSLIELFFS